LNESTALTAQTPFPAITQDLEAVDRVIRDRLQSEVALVSTVADYIVTGGGKRLRPVLLLLFARAHGAHHDARRHVLAAVVEFIHTATLLHDDVVDESTLRRGQQTANSVFGNAASVLVGDFLYSRAFQMMVSAGEMTIMQVLADATNIIAEGEVLQLMNSRDASLDETRYLQVIRYKTAKLFEAAARLGAMIAGADAEEIARAAEYGMRLGTAFQVIDDVLDYAGNAVETGKNLGDDLREGKVTPPLIHVMNHGNEAQRIMVRSAIETGDGDFSAIAQAVAATGALDYARSQALAEAQQARACAENLTPSVYRDALLELTSIAVDRDR
jgi:octaprenyl-diphosphate synthase